MATHDETSDAAWADARMRQLTPDAGWEPNVARGLARLRTGRDSSAVRRRRWMWVVVGGTTATLLLMTTPMARAFAERCGELLASLTGNGATRAYAGRSERRMMPDFTLTDASGRPVRLSDFRGKVVLLNFWTTSCRQCDGEIPWFMEFQETYRDRLVVLGVSLDEDGWTSVRAYQQAKRINYPVMVGGQEVVRQYGRLRSVPTTLIIDKWGQIAVTHVGFCSKAEYEADTKALLAER